MTSFVHCNCTLLGLAGVLAIAVRLQGVAADEGLDVKLLKEWHPRESLGTQGAPFVSYDPKTRHLLVADQSILALASIGEDQELTLLARYADRLARIADSLRVENLEGVKIWGVAWLAWTPGNKFLYLGYGDGSILCFEHAADRLRFMHKTPVEGTLLRFGTTAAFSPDGRFLYVGSMLGAIGVLERNTSSGGLKLGQIIADSKHISKVHPLYRDVAWEKQELRWVDGLLGGPCQIAVLPRNKCLFVASRFQNHLCRLGWSPQGAGITFAGLIDAGKDAQIALPTSLAMTRDGSQFVVGMRGLGAAVFCEDETRTSAKFVIHLMDPEAPAEFGSSIDAVAFSLDDRFLFGASPSARAIYVFERLEQGKRFERRVRMRFDLPPKRVIGAGPDFQVSVVAGPGAREFMVSIPAFNLLRLYRVVDATKPK